MIKVESYWPPVDRGSDAQPLTDRAEVDICREILGCSREPSWWAVARQYLEEEA